MRRWPCVGRYSSREPVDTARPSSLTNAVDDLVRVALARNQIEAEIMVATLEADGIRAMSRDTDFGVASKGITMGPGFGTGSPVEILVLAADAERAHELLHP